MPYEQPDSIDEWWIEGSLRWEMLQEKSHPNRGGFCSVIQSLRGGLCAPAEVLLRGALAVIKHAWRRDENGAVGTHNHAHHQGKHEAFNVVAAKEENRQ